MRKDLYNGKIWTLESFDGTKLFASKSLIEDMKAVVVIVHGLAEHSGRYDYVAKKLNEANFGVYRFDHRGHGKSEGERTHFNDYNDLIDDINHVLELAKKENPDLPIFLIGHSMGGFGVTSFGTKYPQKVNGIVSSGALTRDLNNSVKSALTDLDPSTRIPNELGEGVCSVEEVREDYQNDPLNEKSYSIGLAQQLAKGLDWLEKHPTDFVDPILILHGEKDGLVSYEDSLKFFKEIESEDKQVKIYGKLFHEIFNEYMKDEVIQDAISWIENRI
ncbi:alpha/beta hydrolase [Facklamia miroungae]|nr:alpha/beta hydrolase [Facklamia miroungae]NKZ29756.1 alpha/beta hydrolase [Facklamia miroungae]